ncbi:transglycosylase SLT domain-containing protein [Nonomuraea basaltis]|uniref:aggregation-promoting factor C-terminal-like domain-containing protein n=1 Tax=Nonomuraea basaltis TaxID=2495887 RepID=UPI0030B80B87
MPMLRRIGVLVLTATLVAAGGASAAQAQSSQTSSRNKSIAKPLVSARGWNKAQFRCLERLWARESGWNHRAANGSSGAYGIPQALPGRKMASSGRDWRTNPRTQIKWGLGYIKQRYGSPCRAWAHFQSHRWY